MANIGMIELKKEDAAQIVDGGKKKTTGQVLYLLKENFDLGDDLLSILQLTLDTRNRFIHGFLIESNENIRNPKYRGEVIDEIESMREIILEGDRTLRNI